MSDSSLKLAVSINSFSYKQGIPEDISGNGGGFVFDCRLLENPGKLEIYKTLTGKDKEVIAFLENDVKTHNFIQKIHDIIKQAIEKYQERGFTNLMINFGCTGGQHRSVYCANIIAKLLMEKEGIVVVLKHTALEKNCNLA